MDVFLHVVFWILFLDLSEHGGVCLSTRYVNTDTKLRWRSTRSNSSEPRRRGAFLHPKVEPGRPFGCRV